MIMYQATGIEHMTKVRVSGLTFRRASPRQLRKMDLKSVGSHCADQITSELIACLQDQYGAARRSSSAILAGPPTLSVVPEIR